MGSLFPNSVEYPDYVPMPEALLEAGRLGLPPLMIAELIAMSSLMINHWISHREKP